MISRIPDISPRATSSEISELIQKHITITARTSFPTPFALDRYVTAKQKTRLFASWISCELDIITDHLRLNTRSRQYLWDKLMALVGSMHKKPHNCYKQFDQRVLALAKEIISHEPPLPPPPAHR